METGTIYRTLKGKGNSMWCASFSADGDVLVSGSDTGSISIWKFSTGEVIKVSFPFFFWREKLIFEIAKKFPFD